MINNRNGTPQPQLQNNIGHNQIISKKYSLRYVFQLQRLDSSHMCLKLRNSWMASKMGTDSFKLDNFIFQALYVRTKVIIQEKYLNTQCHSRNIITKFKTKRNKNFHQSQITHLSLQSSCIFCSNTYSFMDSLS